MSKDPNAMYIDEAPTHMESQVGEVIEKPDNNNDFEVFRKGDGTVDFRTVGWIHTSMIYMKITFATGVLSLPSACYVLGAVPGAISIVCWQALNTYCAIVQGNFRNSHAHCHSIADMAEVVGGKWLRELAGILFLASYSIAAASAVFGASVGMNTLSGHALCTNWFLAITAIAVFILASVRKFEKMAWLTWIGFISIFAAVFIVVVGVAVQSRPAAAPQQGDFDLGYHLIGNPTFIAGMTATATIFCSGAGTAAFLPVISEMKKPQDYQKAVYTSMGTITAAYLTFSVVVYYYCGKWTASPSLGSAGPLLQKVSYGVGMPGLLIGACLFVHVAGKYLFVRILRNSEHLQKNTIIHWGTWLGSTAGLSLLTFILASAIPIFTYLVGLAGSLTFAPLSLALPGILWLHDHMHCCNGTALQRVFFILNLGLVALGLFITIGGTYSVIQQIIEAYANGEVSSAFSCADNSNISH